MMQQTVEVYQRIIMLACIVGLVAMALGILAYRLRPQIDAVLRFVKAHPFQSSILVPCLLSLWVYGSTKPTPVTPTVKGITLGEPMETPTSISLAWQPDEGTEISTDQKVTVYWRDAYNTDWSAAAEGYGIMSATITGFFINRDTDWLVEVEGTTNATQEVAQ